MTNKEKCKLYIEHFIQKLQLERESLHISLRSEVNKSNEKPWYRRLFDSKKDILDRYAILIKSNRCQEELWNERLDALESGYLSKESIDRYANLYDLYIGTNVVDTEKNLFSKVENVNESL